ncbi:DUF3080 family protein [Vibrio nigripulchritudo]|uniref:DUF3080 family protein n=1 Tax=Vibrio nigripulchritudo TaxID=28173 RepID=UPI0003B1F2FB|nr:DUF3080 family protein [Vibrio nigripulchritudo]CCN73745.1 conserved hypothetical protein [Vibrio nigripulchritudo SFn118]
MECNALLRITFFASIFFPTGCSDPVTNMYQDYLERVARVQDAPEMDAPEKRFTSLPDKKVLQLTIPRLSLGLLESYELRNCGLFELIAERNSSLGKVQDEFRQLDYETQFVSKASECLSHPKISEEVKSKLTKAYQQKVRQYPLHFQHVFTQSSAWRAQLTGKDWLSEDSMSSVTEVKLALEPFIKISQSIRGRDTSALNSVTPSQEAIETIPVIGNLKYSLDNSTLWLETLTSQLKKYDGNIRCGSNINSTQFKYLRNVFQSQYIEQVQPYLAQLDSAYVKIGEDINFLLEEITVQHGTFFNIEQSHREFKIATLEHVKYWQNLFARCGVKPGR